MKLLLFIIIFLVETIFSKKAIWDGKNVDRSMYKMYVKGFNAKSDIKRLIKLESNIHYLKDGINVFNHITLINVPIFPIDVSHYTPKDNGVTLYRGSKEYIQTYALTHHSKNYFVKEEFSTCHLTHCELGVYIYHKRFGGYDLIKYEIAKFDYVLYVKLITLTGEYLFGSFKVDRNYFPLILCPYDNWVSPYSMVKFNPYERSGIEFGKFLKRHILLPIYKRHVEDNKFLCGYLKYMDGDELKIGFELLITKKGKNMKVKKINVTRDYFVCSDEEKETDYYHFTYNANYKRKIFMRYFNMENLDRIPLLHGEIIYLYKKSDNEIKKLLNDGFNYLRIKGEYPYPRVQPSCGLEINPIPGMLTLRRSDNKDITLNDSNLSDVKILYITNDLLEKRIGLECVIEGEVEESRHNLKYFYNNTFITELVSIDENNNVKTMHQINFANGFLKFGCILKPRFGNKLHKDSKFIKPLYFETIYDKNFIIRRKWENINGISIKCNKKSENKLTDMKVVINSKYKYKMSIEEHEHFFFDENTCVKFKHYEIRKIKDIIRKVKYECFYKSKSGIEFSMKFDGTVLQETITKNIDKKNSSLYGVLLISIITTTTASIIFIIVLIIVLRRKKSRRRHKVKLSKGGKYKYSKERSTSENSSESDSLTGDSQYINKLRTKQEVKNIKK
uniref:6-cysteine protein n=1 Tax=Parastrongyloides trichosuri TaxID=131310 RepID=A0A0N4ZIB2_PARTI